MGLTVYGIVASRASRTLWMLEELGVAYEHVPQDYKNKATRTDQFRALNPNGHIPVLLDDEIVVWESMATTLYLARKFPGELGARNLAEEAEILRWTFWVVNECEKDALQVLFHRVVMEASRRDESVARQAEKRLTVPLTIIDAHLASRQWLAADRFTVAEVNVASVLAWARAMSDFAGQFPHLADWLTRCLARPANRRVRDLARQEKTADDTAGKTSDQPGNPSQETA
ncbi:MAG: glutathione S-transferase family protein [Burkholderiaceae bacterium]